MKKFQELLKAVRAADDLGAMERRPVFHRLAKKAQSMSGVVAELQEVLASATTSSEALDVYSVAAALRQGGMFVGELVQKALDKQSRLSSRESDARHGIDRSKSDSESSVDIGFNANDW